MNPEDKLLNHHIVGMNLLDGEELATMMKKKLKKESYRTIQDNINKETGKVVALSTLHGMATNRKVHRSPGKIMKELGTTNSKLRTALELLKKVDKIDNSIAKSFLVKIKTEIKRLE